MFFSLSHSLQFPVLKNSFRSNFPCLSSQSAPFISHLFITLTKYLKRKVSFGLRFWKFVVQDWVTLLVWGPTEASSGGVRAGAVHLGLRRQRNTGSLLSFYGSLIRELSLPGPPSSNAGPLPALSDAVIRSAVGS